VGGLEINQPRPCPADGSINVGPRVLKVTSRQIVARSFFMGPRFSRQSLVHNSDFRTDIGYLMNCSKIGINRFKGLYSSGAKIL